MRPLRILITTVGGLISPDLIAALKNNGEREVFIVGVDSFEAAVGRYFVDEFVQVVFSGDDEEAFVEGIKEIIAKKRIDIVVPCGNEDNLALAKHRDDLKAKVLVNQYDHLLCAFDKAEVYQLLAQTLPQTAPKYFVVRNYQQFQNAIDELGFPQKKVVVKPAMGRGGRGVYILRGQFDARSVFSEKPTQEMPLEFFERLLKGPSEFEELIVMEHLDPPFFSVYSLIDEAKKTRIALTHIREWGNASQTFRGLVYHDDKLEKLADEINRAFHLCYTSNMELATATDGRVVLFDLNPRLGASSGVDQSIGLNFPYLAVKTLLHEPYDVDKGKFAKQRRFVRYFEKVWTE